ncbi:nucleoside diphosphate kinase regulator [Massilia suwonensis]|uniref:Nucleoside diphosphate kinase regulator n=1 Tax=Massilia suwonensis TaxID=648895 RepID=A0ABW0MNU5_9BURK
MRPPIVVSSLDMERLEQLLDSLPAAQAGTRDALLEELARAELVEPEDMPQDVVTMNSRVRFVLDHGLEEFDMSLAYPKDVNGAADKLSILSPVGNALLGLKVGDSIDWTRPDGGRFEVTVRDVVYQPERAGELHR